MILLELNVTSVLKLLANVVTSNARHQAKIIGHGRAEKRNGMVKKIEIDSSTLEMV